VQQTDDVVAEIVHMFRDDKPTLQEVVIFGAALVIGYILYAWWKSRPIK